LPMTLLNHAVNLEELTSKSLLVLIAFPKRSHLIWRVLRTIGVAFFGVAPKSLFGTTSILRTCQTSCRDCC